MLREENEGFSKLLVELNQPFGLKDLPTVTENISSLIGFFSLDPNRVLDIVLEAFETRLYGDGGFRELDEGCIGF